MVISIISIGSLISLSGAYKETVKKLGKIVEGTGAVGTAYSGVKEIGKDLKEAFTGNTGST